MRCILNATFGCGVSVNVHTVTQNANYVNENRNSHSDQYIQMQHLMQIQMTSPLSESL